MKKVFNKVILFISILIVLGMLVTGFADILDPRSWGWLAMAGYAYPFVLALNLTMIVVCVFFRKRLVLVPFLGMLLCYSPTMKYCPVHLSKEVPDSCLTIISYNTWSFGGMYGADEDNNGRDGRSEILDYVVSQGVDILCCQETPIGSDVLEEIKKRDPQLQYADTITIQKGSVLLLISRYPIVGKERIVYESDGNLSGAFTLDVNGQNVIVVNNHFESNSLSQEERGNFSDMVHGNMNAKSIKSESHFLLSKLTQAARKRAPQVEAVATYVRLHKNQPIILCGDFNDIPISYTRRTIAKELTDCYKETGHGFGFSYRKNAMRVRIDNIMCSSHFELYDCKVDNTIDVSDHYPIIAKLALNEEKLK